ncbi:hypothetical protein EV175_001652 [Coemansia sp. RSA 1933]|nr:hypothetical protein EV175_001652 [Coemansia sp. RSA 1933]
MANTKGGSGSNGPRKRGTRKPKHSGTGVNSTHAHGDDDADKKHAIQPAAPRAAAAAALSGGGQAQMVFTVGTFDEDDGAYIGREPDDIALNASQDLHDRRNSHSKGKENLTVEAVALVEEDSHRSSSQQTTEHDVAELQTSEYLHSEEVTSQQPQPRRQPLFTMGSHSEVSDSDSSDSYDGPLLANKLNGSTGRDAQRIDAVGAHLESTSNPTQKPREEDQPDADSARECCADTSNGCSSESISGCKKDTGERALSPCALHSCKATTSLSQLHALPTVEQTVSQDAGTGLFEIESDKLAKRERVVSAPPARRNSGYSAKGDNTSSSDVVDEERDASEAHFHSKGKMAATREAHLKSRKKTAGKKLHTKRTTSTAALRTRTRHGGGGHRRDYPLSKPLLSTVSAVNESQVDGSYVDYSGNSSFGDDAGPKQDDADPPPPQQQQQQQNGSNSLPNTDSHAMVPNASVPDQSRASLNSSTATLGVGGGQDIDDTATTASIDSPRQEPVDGPLSNHEGVGENGNSQRQQRNNQHALSETGSAPTKEQPLATMAETSHSAQSPRHDSTSMRRSQSSAYGLSDGPSGSNVEHSPHTDSADVLPMHDGGARRHRRQARGTSSDQAHFQGQGSGKLPDEHVANTSSSQTAYVSKSSKRNIESQRQQGIVEKEEEDMDIANSQLTGVPRRSNRPVGMVPNVFLQPDLPAYSQQVRKTDRLYAYSRTMAHPLLESMVRCAELREQRLALSSLRGNPRPLVSRRMLTEPSEADSQAEWWESLMPPPPSSGPHRDQRMALRMQAAELPKWMAEPDDAKRVVYGAETDPLLAHGHHDLVDPSCAHIRELRLRAKELRISRQHNATAGRNNVLPSVRGLASTSDAALETWRGRRIPGLLNVDMYANALGPLDSGARQSGGRWLGSETALSSSPENTHANAAHGNPLVSPYRRYGTVYGYTAANTTNYRSGGNVNGPGALGGGGGGGSSGTHTSLRSNSRGHESMPSSRPGTAGIWENDPRRSSYFDRISVDELRPNVVASSVATQTTPAGLLRRVISGLTGGATSAFGTSQ